MKARKRPVVVDAWPWPEVPKGAPVNTVGGYPIAFHMVETLEGYMKRDKGDWLIKGINGEYYPCKPDIFEKTYEIVEP